jgi:hypothetical protein
MHTNHTNYIVINLKYVLIVYKESFKVSHYHIYSLFKTTKNGLYTNYIIINLFYLINMKAILLVLLLVTLSLQLRERTEQIY